MSQTLELELQVKDMSVLELACRKLGITLNKVRKKIRFFSSTEDIVASFQLPGWKYEVGIKEDGTIVYDNYEGSWGDISKLNEVQKEYSTEKIKRECRRKGISFYERRVEGGTKLTLNLGDGNGNGEW